ncbi:unnamed protein product [Lactuca virosa]|uniref:Magnesium transporter n=1 Tax=Lactuca virosa TaxID=75947 RepID=A0AAU9PNW7_9ASTR|nr:unnamed protein product [Lactuca virosa]
MKHMKPPFMKHQKAAELQTGQSPLLLDQIPRLTETETSPFTQFIMWSLSGSRYSGLNSVSMNHDNIIHVVKKNLTAIIWTCKCQESICFKSCYWLYFFDNFHLLRLPLSQAMLLSFTIPLMASISVGFILHENFKIEEIAGIASSFFGVIFIISSMVSVQGTEGGQQVDEVHYFYVFLIGLLSSLTGGMSYCFIRAGAKQSDQPVVTIFSFGLVSTPAATICMITFEDFVLPSFYSFLLMIILAILAFVAENGFYPLMPLTTLLVCCLHGYHKHLLTKRGREGDQGNSFKFSLFANKKFGSWKYRRVFISCFAASEPLAQASTAKSRFSAKDYIDHMALVRAYEGWKEVEREGSAYEYCWRNFLSAQTLQAIHSLRNQFIHILKDAQLRETKSGINNRLSHNQSLVRAIICSGLFPGIASVVVGGGEVQYHGEVARLKVAMKIVIG